MKEKIDEIIKELTADKKKLGFMIALIAVGMLLWGRLMLKQAPRTAVADPDQVSAVIDSDLTGGALWSGDAGRVVYVDFPEEVSRDLFALDLTNYTPTARPSDDGWNQGKSKVEVTDENLAIRDAALQLVLQSTILGDQPRAVINGRTLAVGQSIEGFTLMEVRHRRVILMIESVKILLSM